MSKLDHVDDCMKSLGLVLNLLDPDGSLGKEAPPEHLLRGIMQAVKVEYIKLSDAILALREESTSKIRHVCSICGHEDPEEEQEA